MESVEFGYVTYTPYISEHQPHLAYHIHKKSSNNTLDYKSTGDDDLQESKGYQCSGVVI